MYSYFYRSGNSRTEGVEILKYKISLPYFAEKERMSGFYRAIADKVCDFCEGELKTYAEGEYEKNESEKKKFDYPVLLYNLNGRVVYDRDGYIFVLLEALLKKRGERTRICRRYDSHGWDTSREMLMRPKDILQIAFGEQKPPKEIRKEKNIFISDGKLFCCEGDRVYEAELPEKVLLKI